MIIMPQCTFCRHFLGFDGTVGKCRAFPDGVPTAILDNKFDHKQSYPGDHNIRWEQSQDSLDSVGPVDLFTETGQPEPVLSKAS